MYEDYKNFVKIYVSATNFAKWSHCLSPHVISGHTQFLAERCHIELRLVLSTYRKSHMEILKIWSKMAP